MTLIDKSIVHFLRGKYFKKKGGINLLGKCDQNYRDY